MPGACGAVVGSGGVPRTITEPHDSRSGPCVRPTIDAGAGSACNDPTRDLAHDTPGPGCLRHVYAQDT